MTTTSKVRVTLDLTPSMFKRLSRLEKLLDANSKADVLRQSLQLLEYVAERRARGDEFCVRARDGAEQVVVPIG